jgi:hypothetical protein
MKQTVIVLTLLLASLAALALSRGVVLLDGAAERWACFGLGMVAGWAILSGLAWFVVDDLRAKGKLP